MRGSVLVFPGYIFVKIREMSWQLYYAFFIMLFNYPGVERI